MMRGFSILLIFFTVSAFADEPFDFRSAKLGMTLSEFRQLPFPDAQTFVSRTGAAPEVVCTGHPGLDATEIILRPRGVEQVLGVVKCVWAVRGELKLNKSIYYARPMISVGGAQSQDVLYYFVRRPSDGELRLYRISVSSIDSDHFERLSRGLTDRFGPPAKTEHEVVQNRMGAKFPNTTMLWRNSQSVIYAAQRASTIDKMALAYSHVELSEFVEKERGRLEGKPSDKL